MDYNTRQSAIIDLINAATRKAKNAADLWGDSNPRDSNHKELLERAIDSAHRVNALKRVKDLLGV